MKINSFKDQCDNCNKFDYLVSINNKCLCSECIKKENKQNNQKIIKIEQKQLNILDFIEKLSHFSHTIDDIM